MKKYTIIKAKRIIERNRGKVAPPNAELPIRTITCARPGLKVLGAIDFLVNFQAYRWIRRNLCAKN